MIAKGMKVMSFGAFPSFTFPSVDASIVRNHLIEAIINTSRSSIPPSL